MIRRRTKVRSRRGRAKIRVVMGEYKRGRLRSSSGQTVTNPKQAIAIGMSEGRKAEAGVPFRRRTFLGRTRMRPVLQRGRRRRRVAA